MPKSPHLITIDDSVNLKLGNDAQISADGKFLAFTDDARFKIDTKHPKSQIWLTNPNRDSAPQFTTGTCTDNIPRWSLDGSADAFLSDRIEDIKPQIYLISLGGSEARRITKPRAISSICNGSTMANALHLLDLNRREFEWFVNYLR